MDVGSPLVANHQAPEPMQPGERPFDNQQEQVRKICALLDQGVSPRMIGFKFGVDAKSIRNIDQGKTWGHLPEEVAQRADIPRRRRRRGWWRYGR
jgi:hypothetical protein